ncbi:MAG: response regulator [Leptolyngbyaceae cyanobacterium CSU_1_4]|nr:response regulator [Leptolyngbyaceae cyanobacterium CSU_1_4]
MRILLVDDDKSLMTLLRAKLVSQQYVVDVASDGKEGWELTEALNYDLIVLEVMLPKLDGISFCRRLREKNSQSLVLLLTAKETLNDKIMGLDAGADDYLIKPMPMPELVARIKALLRRRIATVSSVLEWGALRLNVDNCKVTYENQPLNLTAKEYALLELFLRNPQQIFSQGAILTQLWSFEVDPPGGETVRAHIKRLRQKLKTVGAEDLVETVYGLGYRLNHIVKEFKPGRRVNSGEQQDFLNVQNTQGEEHLVNAGCEDTTQVLSCALGMEQGTDFLLKKSALTRILMIDRNQAFIDRFVTEAGTKDIQTAIALTLSAAQESIQRVRPDGVIIDLSQFDQTEGLKLLEDLGQVSRSSIPVLVLTDPYQSLDRVAIARRKGRGFLQKPIAAERVLAAMIQELKPLNPNESKIMVVDDDRMVLRLLHVTLEPWGLQVTTLDNPLNFWEQLEAVKPDLLILDVNLPEIDGIELCQTLRNDSQWAWLPILFLTGQQDFESIQKIFAAGADDYVSKPIIAPELMTRILNRLERTRLLRRQVEVDALTNLPNRSRANQDLNKFLQIAKHSQQPVCLAVLAIDHLVHINRQHGYRVGDQMLRQLALTLQQELRHADIVARWEGAEFVVGIYGATRQDGSKWLLEILNLLPPVPIPASNQTSVQITFSAGVAQYPDDGTTVQALYQAAEAILEQTKLEEHHQSKKLC